MSTFPDQAGFERWAKGQGMNVTRTTCDPAWTYTHVETEYAWRGWANCPASALDDNGGRIPDNLVTAAINALYSYAYGNAAPELAKSMAEKLATARGAFATGGVVDLTARVDHIDDAGYVHWKQPRPDKRSRDLAKRLDKTEAAAKALLNKLDEIVAHDSYLGVFMSAANHGVKYTGPTFTQEQADLKVLLEAKHD
jgi:hypothetical protein